MNHQSGVDGRNLEFYQLPKAAKPHRIDAAFHRGFVCHSASRRFLFISIAVSRLSNMGRRIEH